MADTLLPSRDAALARIARVQPADYARSRNHLDGAVTGAMVSGVRTHDLTAALPLLVAAVLRVLAARRESEADEPTP